MKKFIFLFFFASLFTFSRIWSQQLKGDSWKSVKTKGTGEITMIFNYSGEFMNNGSIGLEGLCYQIWQEFIQNV